MRKEVRSLAVGATAHIVDRFGGKTGVPKLKLDELAQVAVRSLSAAIDNRSASRSAFELPRDFFANLKRPDPDARSDRGHELGGIML